MRARDFVARGGAGLLHTYGGSLPRLLATHFPEHMWDRTRFSRRPTGYWQREGVQRAFLETLRAKLGLPPNDHAAWYQVSNARFVAAGGAPLLAQHRNSLAVMLPTLIPEHTWDVTRFSKRPRGYWSATTQRAFAVELGQKLGIAEGDYEAWYRVDSRAVLDVGGATLLAQFDFSLSQLLAAVFPEHDWDVMRFPSKPRDYWQDVSNAREFLKGVARQLGHAEGDMEAWYQVSRRELLKCGARGLLKHFGDSPRTLLTSVFPEHDWLPWRFKHFRRTAHALWQVPRLSSRSSLPLPPLTLYAHVGRDGAARNGKAD